MDPTQRRFGCALLHLKRIDKGSLRHRDRKGHNRQDDKASAHIGNCKAQFLGREAGD
jgi:hypothetical protein